jgi:hypothetical protein
MLGGRCGAMRKRLIGGMGTAVERGVTEETEAWIDLETAAEVEISSEAEGAPIEGALETGGDGAGWRAATTGPQTIRLRFDQPTAIRRIYLHFVEREAERSQEFSVYAGSGEGKPREGDAGLREVVRQQFAFSPGGATEEIEDYSVELKEVTVFELRIDPDRAHDPKQSRTHASLVRLRLG